MIKKIGLIDYKCGNIGSIANALAYLKYDFEKIKKKDELLDFEKIILPGVGSFDHAAEELNKNDLFDGLKIWAKNKTNRILGICLGLQLLCRKSKESIKDTQGLNLIQGDVINLNDIKKIKKVPHMGWSTVTIKNNTILSQKNNNRDFYFAHSYAVELDDKKFELGTTTCHEYQISSIVTNNENVYGFQFHPEKSHQQGLNILKEFITNA